MMEKPRFGALGTKGALTHPPEASLCCKLLEARLVGQCCLPWPRSLEDDSTSIQLRLRPQELQWAPSLGNTPLFFLLSIPLVSSSCISLPAPLCWKFHAGQLWGVGKGGRFIQELLSRSLLCVQVICLLEFSLAFCFACSPWSGSSQSKSHHPFPEMLASFLIGSSFSLPASLPPSLPSTPAFFLSFPSLLLPPHVFFRPGTSGALCDLSRAGGWSQGRWQG